MRTFYHSRWAITFLLLGNAFIYLYLIFGHRMPPVHDTWQHLSLQYYFLNQLATQGEIPRWMPLMTHGTVANWWFIFQNNMLQSIYFDFGSWWNGHNFLPWYYISIFFEEILLLLGMWLYSGRHFSLMTTRFFVCISVLGSAIWIDQIAWNFHCYYSLPLVLYLLHEAVDRTSAKYAFLGCNLLAYTLFGNALYIIAAYAAFFVAYFIFYFALVDTGRFKKLVQYKFKSTDFIWFALSIFSFIYIFALAKWGTQFTKLNAYGRDGQGGLSLETFLTYGGSISLEKYFDSFMAMTTRVDQTLYMGALIIPFTVYALVKNLTKQVLHIVFLILLILLFSIGAQSFISSTSFFLMPLMKMFRHIGLFSSISKIFLPIIAGYGFEHFLRSGIHSIQARSIVSTILILLELFLLASFFSGRYIQTDQLFVLSGIYALFAVLFLATLLKVDTTKIIILVVMFHFLDVFGYKFYIFHEKTTRLSSEGYESFRIQSSDYLPRRTFDYNSNRRFKALRNALLYSGRRTTYWTTENVLEMDTVESMFRTDLWQIPLDEFIKSFVKNSDSFEAAMRTNGRFYTPRTIASDKYVGFSEDKIQMYSKAYALSKPEVIDRLFQDPDFSGDVLILSEFDGKAVEKIPVKSNDRLYPEISVDKYTNNSIEITVGDLPDHPTWLFYSDVWHPFWHSKVDGHERQVYQANIAYKAVELNPRQSHIKFFFNSNVLTFLMMLAIIHSHLWSLIVAILLFQFLFLGSKKEAL